MSDNTVSYYLSADHWGDGKSVCLWRKQGVQCRKMARFQTDHAASKFAEELEFPLSESLANRLQKSKEEVK